MSPQERQMREYLTSLNKKMIMARALSEIIFLYAAFMVMAIMSLCFDSHLSQRASDLLVFLAHVPLFTLVFSRIFLEPISRYIQDYESWYTNIEDNIKQGINKHQMIGPPPKPPQLDILELVKVIMKCIYDAPESIVLALKPIIKKIREKLKSTKN